MNSPKIANTWILGPIRFSIPVELRIKWDNNRFHSVAIKPPHGKAEVVDALESLIVLVKNDPHLDTQKGE